MGSPPSPKFHTDKNFKKKYFSLPPTRLGKFRPLNFPPSSQNCRRPSVFSAAANASGLRAAASSGLVAVVYLFGAAFFRSQKKVGLPHIFAGSLLNPKLSVFSEN
ncbi:hypothetical protein ACP275_06G076300 [Erythranthe tilingii]